MLLFVPLLDAVAIRPRTRGRLHAILAMLALVPASALAGTSLGDALLRASALDPDTVVLQARGAEVSASRSVAEALFPGAAAVSAGLRRDRPDHDLGRNEIDLELGLPLWLPGQRESRARVAEREGDALAAARAEARWRLAGRLREAWGRIELARAEALAAERRGITLARVEADAARRVGAGVLARSDLLLAQAELAAARALTEEAALRVEIAERTWRELTGDRDVPTAIVDAGLGVPDLAARGAPGAGAEAVDRHPAREGARSRVDLALAQLAWVNGSRRDAPELALAHRSDRAEHGADYRNTVRVALRIPFASEARNAPRIAAAGTTVARAQAELLQLDRQLQLDRAQAVGALEAAHRQVERVIERVRAATEHERLVDRAYALGEQSLTALLRAVALREDAQADLDRARVATSVSRARLAQALGVTP